MLTLLLSGGPHTSCISASPRAVNESPDPDKLAFPSLGSFGSMRISQTCLSIFKKTPKVNIYCQNVQASQRDLIRVLDNDAAVLKREARPLGLWSFQQSFQCWFVASDPIQTAGPSSAGVTV